MKKNYGLTVSTAIIANMKNNLGFEKQFLYAEDEMAAKKVTGCPKEKR